ncbi:MAG: nuclear transport factor 2 family protein [Myxococcota bacterium]
MNPDRIADELAIRELVDRYADAIVRRDEEAWRATWAADGEWHILGECVRGHAALVEKWNALMSGLPFVHQIASGGLVEFEGDHARGRFYVNEYATLLDGTGLLMLGVYFDRYVFETADWVFSSRRIHPLYMGPPDMSGVSNPFPSDWE